MAASMSRLRHLREAPGKAGDALKHDNSAMIVSCRRPVMRAIDVHNAWRCATSGKASRPSVVSSQQQVKGAGFS